MRRSFILSSTGLLVVLGLVDAQSPKAAALIKELSDKNPAVRRSAAQEIGDLADVRITDAKAALPALKEALGKDADPAVRSAVLTALGKIEPDQFPALLTDVLKKDKEGQVQIAAIAALGQLAQQGKRATDAIPVLMEVYKASPQAPATPPKTPPPPNTPATDPPAVRRAILQAYAQLQPDVKERIPFLTDSLKAEKDNGVRTVLINALGQAGPPAKSAVPVLLEVQKASYQEAAKIPVTPKGPPPDLDPQGVRRAIVQNLGRINPDPKEYVPILIDALKTDKAATVQLAAVQALSQIGPNAKEALPALLDVHKSAGLPGDPGGLRKAIVTAVIRIETDAKASVPVLTSLLKVEKEPAVRVALISALGDIGPPARSAVPVLLEVQKASPPTPKVLDPSGVRKAIVEALAKIESDAKTLVPILINAVRLERDAGVRQAAVTALGKVGPEAKAAVPTLQELIKLPKTAKDEDKALAKLAEEALGKIQPK